MVPNQMIGVFIREEDAQTRHIERTPCADGGRVWSDVATSQSTPRTVGNHQKLGRGKGGFFSRAFRGGMGVDLLTPRFQTYSL